MIVIRVELHSANTGKVTELARALIVNDGTGTMQRRNYIARTLRGRSKDQLDKRTVSREARLNYWPSERLHVWRLVCSALCAMGYDV